MNSGSGYSLRYARSRVHPAGRRLCRCRVAWLIRLRLQIICVLGRTPGFATSIAMVASVRKRQT